MNDNPFYAALASTPSPSSPPYKAVLTASHQPPELPALRIRQRP